ncbi:MAG TPA: hypothetical protein VFW87_06185 [Pirellulales bacterium]|nr:hypothetical protein [Pirellulales bacterium]
MLQLLMGGVNWQRQMTAPRFSLKWLLAVVAMLAFSIAALVSASYPWLVAAFALLSGSLLLAILTAACGIGDRRGFAIGFAVGTLFYLSVWHASRHHWLGLHDPQSLATDLAVDESFRLIAKQAPPSEGNPAGVGGVVFGTGLPTFTPDYISYYSIAHWLIAWYAGLASGSFARWISHPSSNSAMTSPVGTNRSGRPN